ncbi:MAG: hypothetical protein C0593_00480 [Marinilabiliales bacterium]|nr:MAG: hypothetical protein C0593_00480 [Marinilabiliales bacterium]
MNILFDIGHPAHVHYFKFVIRALQKEGHHIYITARERYPVFELLEAYGLKYFNRGKGANSKIGKILNIFIIDYKLFRFAKKNKINLMVGFGSFYISHVAKFLGIPSIILDDTDNATFGQFLYRPFATKILSPESFSKDFGKKHKKFRSFMELSYLHPDYFSASPEFRKDIKLESDEKYTLIRFVSWNAHHDIGHKGITVENKINAVHRFSKYGKVFITSEGELPNELKKYEIKIEPHKMHDVIAGASLLFGESATMASEAAMLGVPAIFIDDDGRSYTNELQKRYGIVWNFTESVRDQQLAVEMGCSILSGKENSFTNTSSRIFSENINVTEYILNEIKESLK